MGDNGDDDLDALLDDALECFDQEAKAEEERQEERKKEKEKIEANGGSDDELTNLLEKTLLQLKDTGEEEDAHLRDLVEQGLNLMKGDGEGGDDQEVFAKCLGLLQNVTKEISKGDESASGPMAAMNPLMQQLSQAVGDVVTGLQDGADQSADPNVLGSAEEQEKLLNVMKELGAATQSAGGSGPPESMDENSQKMLADMMAAFTSQGQASSSPAGDAGASGEAAPSPEDFLKSLGAAGAGGAMPDFGKALQVCLEELSQAEPTSDEDKAELARLKSDMRDSLKDVPSEMQETITKMMETLDKVGTGAGKPEATEPAAEPAAAATTEQAEERKPEEES
eukprot:TRINITY_DN6655_c0_g1_i1.p1 TRINITY_DN6655_c0_g1~~TRINITY_DN6655_c0_g1_i1.p1  ORF type:complete len:356 (+),score=150.36 TRINITY_DN6655_c0_g1_i1:56-1069(+)